MGGYSSEYGVSIRSGNNIFEEIDRNQYEVYGIEISSSGHKVWDENKNNIRFDKDQMSVFKNDKFIQLDLILNLVHGNPGEDGTLALQWENLGIPYSSSAPGPSSLTFHKAWTNGVVSRMGAVVPKALLTTVDSHIPTLKAKLRDFKFPIFVKPSRAGSSFGITKINSLDDLDCSILIASKEDNSIIIEEGISGIELACGLIEIKKEIKILGITQIISKNEFFDYEAKYSGLSEEVTPANISELNSQKISAVSKEIYSKLGLKGFCRFDFILPENKSAVLIEINTVPGMTLESIIPKQLEYLKMSLKEFINLLSQEVLENGKNRNFPGIF